MIQVFKNPEPEWLIDWKKEETPDWKASYSNLRDKERLKASLIKEQGGLCCYCGREIVPKESHNEHFKPQSQYPDLDTDYGNLHASCFKELKVGGILHCGHAKEDNFDENLCISPLEEGCEQRFVYTLEGEILPKDTDDECAKYMIKILNLNANPLVGRRKDILTKTLPPEFFDEVSCEELQKLSIGYTKRDENGNFDEFRQVLTRYIEQNLPETIESKK